MRTAILAAALCLATLTAAHAQSGLCSYVWIDGYERLVCLDKPGIGPVRR